MLLLTSAFVGAKTIGDPIRDARSRFYVRRPRSIYRRLDCQILLNQCTNRDDGVVLRTIQVREFLESESYAIFGHVSSNFRPKRGPPPVPTHSRSSRSMRTVVLASSNQGSSCADMAMAPFPFPLALLKHDEAAAGLLFDEQRPDLKASGACCESMV